VVYTVTYTNACYKSARQQVVVRYRNTAVNPAPVFYNQQNSEYEFSFEMDSLRNSEWLSIEITETSTGATVFTSGQMDAGVDYDPALSFEFFAPLFPQTSVCNDYTVDVYSKNACNSTVSHNSFEWNRSQFCNPKPQILISPNVFTPNGDGINDCYAPTICGADLIDYDVFNQWGNSILSVTNKMVTSSTPCLWDGGNASDGVYIIEYTVKGCGNSATQFPINVTLIR
jgi:hypothetical protein